MTWDDLDSISRDETWAQSLLHHIKKRNQRKNNFAYLIYWTSFYSCKDQKVYYEETRLEYLLSYWSRFSSVPLRECIELAFT
jgi:hypothetical protein